MQDYYEILQVHPKADPEAIEAAYRRLRERYDPALLEGAADELLELARKRRDDIERAFAVLGDPMRRRSYDGELQERTAAAAPATHAPVRRRSAPAIEENGEAPLDYRPLPPARRQERPREFNTQPTLPPQRATQRGGRQASAPRPPWIVPIVLVGIITFGVMLVSLLIAGGTAPPAASTAGSGPATLTTPGSAVATPTDAEIINQFEGQIVEARQVAQSAPDNANAWIIYGNLLYDSVQIVRERLPASSTYIERLPRWIEASQAYSEALKLQPDNAEVRSDLAASLCYYGAGTGDQDYVAQGVAEAQRARTLAPAAGRVLLNLGVCLVNTDPPQTEQALESWRKVLAVVPTDSGLAFQAQLLIDQHTQ